MRNWKLCIFTFHKENYEGEHIHLSCQLLLTVVSRLLINFFFFFVLFSGFFLLIFLIVLVLTEFTTMAGRRLRDAVKSVLTSGGDFNSNVHVVIAGLTNTYSQYVTTFEEYEVQRYEVSSWFYGTNMHVEL